MKKLQLLTVLLLLPLLSWAQTRVNASDVIAKINRGEAVSYRDAEIIGDLDMTKLQNMQLKKEGNSYDSKEYISRVTAPLSFTNCTFKGDVLAFFNPNSGFNMSKSSVNELYNTNFERDVVFENCVFEKKTAFKYSEFKQRASFAGSQFNEEAIFKYSKFATPVNFSKTSFKDAAIFKYVDFPDMANFSGASFADEADFKYTRFPKGVSFQQAVFNGLANFKYTELSDPVNLQGVAFKGSDDFKYTKINNRKATLATLMEKSR